jgi:ribosomal protection tetracycline resistance protein
MNIINIGIVAHVDAGKTSLTERILFETKVIDKIGRVDEGTTQTDSLDLEKRRGITIKASVVSFPVQDIKVNLIDTPGHADFIAEVERSFSALDGAILVISAVEGIQAQTKFLMSILVQLGIPAILFINKIDRVGAQAHSLVEQIREKLAERVLPLYTPENLGTKQPSIVANSFDSAHNPAFVEAAIDLLAQHDEALLEAYVNETLSERQLIRSLTSQIKEAKLYPIFFGSAMTGVGVAELLKGVATFFPTNTGAENEPLSAVVFKIEREASGEKIAYLRLYAGSFQVREELVLRRRRDEDESELRSDKVKKLHIFRAGKSVQHPSVGAGDFCKIWGFRDIRIGDVVGEWCDKIRELHFVSPQMEARIETTDPAQNHHLFHALTQLCEEDPLIKVIKDPFHQELYLRFFGEVQKEVLEAMLLERYGLTIRFSETRVVCIEKPIGTGQAFELMGAGNPFVATVGFRVEPGNPGSGIVYSYEVQLGSLPLVLHRTIEATVRDVLKQGIYGWEVVDIAVILTHTGYSSVATTAGDFRLLVPLVLMEALVEAGTEVYEPLNDFELSAPTHVLSTAMYRLTLAKALFEQPILRSDSFVLTGALPAATTEEFKRELYTFAGGEGIFVTKPAGFRKIEGDFPTRKRADNNPLNRKEYLFNVGR